MSLIYPHIKPYIKILIESVAIGLNWNQLDSGLKLLVFIGLQEMAFIKLILLPFKLISSKKLMYTVCYFNLSCLLARSNILNSSKVRNSNFTLLVEKSITTSSPILF